jgi:hypothetical protein
MALTLITSKAPRSQNFNGPCPDGWGFRTHCIYANIDHCPSYWCEKKYCASPKNFFSSNIIGAVRR